MYVEVVEYRPEWPAMFEREASLLRGAFGPELTAIFHIGSTAVPGLAAKPVIDIMPVVRDLAAVDAGKRRFEELGYEYLGEFGIPGRRYMRKGGDRRTHQVHVFAADDRQNIERHLAVRNYLREYPQEAAEYGALKAELARRFPLDIEKYCDGKDAFVRELESRALAWQRTLRPQPV